MNKLNALFIGNCQTGGVIHYLLKSKEYLENSDNFYIQRIKNYLETNHPCYNGI